jgi:dipeptidyl aminopeptidase/acylaminoacyl peptidase
LTATPVAAASEAITPASIAWSEAPPCENQPQDLATWLDYISNPTLTQNIVAHLHELQTLEPTFQNITPEELLVLLNLPQDDNANLILREVAVLWLNILSGRLNRATELEIPTHPEIRTVNDLLLNLEQALAERKIDKTLLEASQQVQTGHYISRPVCFRLAYRFGSLLRKNGWTTDGPLEQELSLADVPQGLTFFSPDYNKLVIETAQSDTGGGPLYLFDIQTQQLVNLNQQLEMAHYGGPTGLTFGGWHPDSHHLLLIDNNNERVIWADLATNDYHPIKLNPDPTTFIPFREVALAPQGDYFTYITINADQQTVINRYDLAKQEITPLTRLEVHPAQIKAWRFSPNGDKAAYLLKKGKRLTGVSYNLELFDLTTATNSTLVEGNLGRTEPVWSPDGRMIAFSRKSLD